MVSQRGSWPVEEDHGWVRVIQDGGQYYTNACEVIAAYHLSQMTQFTETGAGDRDTGSIVTSADPLILILI